MSARQLRAASARAFSTNGPRGFGFAFLNQRAGDVQPAVGITGFGFGDAVEGVFGALQIALQQQADAPIVPAFAILLADDGLPLRLAELDCGGGAGQGDDGQIGNRSGVEGVFAAVGIDARASPDLATPAKANWV